MNSRHYLLVLIVAITITLKNFIFKGKMSSLHKLMYRKLMHSSNTKRGNQFLILKVIHKKLFLRLLSKLNFKIKSLFTNVFNNSYYSVRNSLFQFKQILFYQTYQNGSITLKSRSSVSFLKKINSIFEKVLSNNSLIFLSTSANVVSGNSDVISCLHRLFGNSLQKCLFFDALYWDIKKELRCFYEYTFLSLFYKAESVLLVNFSYFLKNLVLNINLIKIKSLYYEDIWNLAGFSQPTRFRKFTVLRSPHIDKKSREQFERRVYKKGFLLPYFFHPSLESSFLKKRLSNELFFSVYSKIIKYSG